MLKLWVKGQLAYRNLVERVRSALKDSAGTTVSEYALVLALVTVAVIGVLTSLGTTLKDKITDVIGSLNGATTP